MDNSVMSRQALGSITARYFLLAVMFTFVCMILQHTHLLLVIAGPLEKLAWLVSYSWPSLWSQYLFLESQLGVNAAATYIFFNVTLLAYVVAGVTWISRKIYKIGNPIKVSFQVVWFWFGATATVVIVALYDNPYDTRIGPVYRFFADPFGLFLVRQLLLFSVVLGALFAWFCVIKALFDASKNWRSSVKGKDSGPLVSTSPE
jgi:hypothetical protein